MKCNIGASSSAYGNFCRCRDVIWTFCFGYIKLGCGMGPWLVLVSPYFRDNVVATCKLGSFLCSIDNLLQKNVIVLFFGNQISKWRSCEKKGYFWLTFTFLVTREKLQKFLQHISHLHTRILLTLLTFYLTNFEKKKYEFIRYGFSLVWVLVLILICAILEQSINNKMVRKLSWNVCYWYVLH